MYSIPLFFCFIRRIHLLAGQQGADPRHHGERASGHQVSSVERVLLRPQRLPSTGAFPLQACSSSHP